MPAAAACLLLALTTQLNDDRDVIQTALLSFFKHEDWHSADWEPKNHVILRPTYSPKTREPFATALKEAKQNAQRDLAYIQKALPDPKYDADDKARLKKALRQAESELIGIADIEKHMHEGFPYEPSSIVQPTSLTWDKRIRVTEKSNRFTFREDKNTDKSLEEWTIYASAAPPTYSPNGRYALLNLHIPWSIHGSDIYFFFERKGSNWVKKFVQAKFYV